MTTAGYFAQPNVPPPLTVLYHADGRTAYAYRHVLLRPVGALNASATDMEAFIQFMLNRGERAGSQIVPASAIRSMELPETYNGARAGLTIGYGKSDAIQEENGFVWYGHEGGIDGGRSSLAYLPEYRIGYFFSANGGESGAAGFLLDRTLRAFLTQGLKIAAAPAVVRTSSETTQHYSGWYQPWSPQVQDMYFLQRLLPIAVAVDGSGMTVTPFLGRSRSLVGMGKGLYRAAQEPRASFALMDSPDGPLLLSPNDSFLKIPAALVWLQLGASLLFVLAVLSVLIRALVWVVRSLFSRKQGWRYPLLQRWPLVASLCVAGSVTLLVVSADDLADRFGTITTYSLALCALTLIFAAASVLALVMAFRRREAHVRRIAYWHSLVVSCAFAGAGGYLLYWGVIGYRSWL